MTILTPDRANKLANKLYPTPSQIQLGYLVQDVMDLMSRRYAEIVVLGGYMDGDLGWVKVTPARMRMMILKQARREWKDRGALKHAMHTGVMMAHPMGQVLYVGGDQ
jgi:hypothetical protein